MTTITVTCATCSGTGDATHGDRHTSTNMDRCRTCGGTGQVPARPGESRETSWPFAVPGAMQPAAPATPSSEVDVEGLAPFQQRVDPWLIACFGEQIARDKPERAHRFLEEALELVQAAGCTAHEAHQLVDYVYGRPAGEMAQEVGGVMTTLAAFCLAHGLDMHQAGETELARIWTKVEKIRAKQAAKPKHSPLPEHDSPVAVGQALSPSRQEGGGRSAADLESLADDFVLRVSEWDDRTSPEDWPEALLITRGELRCELLAFVKEAVSLFPPPSQEKSEGRDA